MGSELLLCRSSAYVVDRVETGVCVLVAVDRQEEGVERGADVGRVESRSDKVTRVARSGILATAIDRSFFQSEGVEFSHSFCELICLKIKYDKFNEKNLPIEFACCQFEWPPADRK